MELTTNQIESFQDLYKQKFDIELTHSEALTLGIKVITLCKPIMLPGTKEVGQE